MAIGLSSFKKKYLFGTGNLEKLRGIVLGNERITAVSGITVQNTSSIGIEPKTGVSILRYINISILIKYSNFSGFYKKLGPFYKKLRCDKFGN